MRIHNAALIVLALAALFVADNTRTRAQSGDDVAYSGSDLMAGKRLTKQECNALRFSVWVSVPPQDECIRYYFANSNSPRSDVLVFISEDVVQVNGRKVAKPSDFYLKLTPGLIQRGSENWARTLDVPYIHLARPGTYGSSGNHAERRTPREIAVVSAAIDAIKTAHGFKLVHLVGHGEGGHTVAALLPKRVDVGCAVMSSALLSLRSRLKEMGQSLDPTGNKDVVDPIDAVREIANRPELRIFVLTDPDDYVISATSQTAYAQRLQMLGLPSRQIYATANDTSSHDLWRIARPLAADCMREMSMDAIVGKYQNKNPDKAIATEAPVHQPETLSRGVSITEAQCDKLTSAVWVKVEGSGYCVRYFLSKAGGDKDPPLVYFNGDIGDTVDGKTEFTPPSMLLWTAEGLQREAHYWSKFYGGPYITIGRVGTFGSSGNHLKDRRTALEVDIVQAALDVIKQRHGFNRFHMVGQSGGGHTVAALAMRRSDIGCAVMTSGVLAVKLREQLKGKTIGTRLQSMYDPIDNISKMKPVPGERLIVISDPDDRVVSYKSQREFVDRAKASNLPILHIAAEASDEKFHSLGSVGRRLATDCAKDKDDKTLIGQYQNKVLPADTTASAKKKGS